MPTAASSVRKWRVFLQIVLVLFCTLTFPESFRCPHAERNQEMREKVGFASALRKTREISQVLRVRGLKGVFRQIKKCRASKPLRACLRRLFSRAAALRHFFAVFRRCGEVVAAGKSLPAALLLGVRDAGASTGWWVALAAKKLVDFRLFPALFPKTLRFR